MNESSNTLADLLTHKELQEYNKTEYPFNLSILHNALKLKLQADPNYEVWVPLVYYRLSTHYKNRNRELAVRPHKTFISNKGNFHSDREILSQYLPCGYSTVGLEVGRNLVFLFVHRALACSFIPLQEAHAGSHPKHLQVNHLDGVKRNYDLMNLEWTTSKGNVNHAFEIGLTVRKKGAESGKTKPVKGRILSGERAGHEFVLFGTKDCEANGFTPSLISKCIHNVTRTHKNCSWSFATAEEIATLPRGLI